MRFAKNIETKMPFSVIRIRQQFSFCYLDSFRTIKSTAQLISYELVLMTRIDIYVDIDNLKLSVAQVKYIRTLKDSIFLCVFFLKWFSHFSDLTSKP